MPVRNWEDYRFVAVIARTGLLPEASRLRSVDRSTVRRRIKGLKARLGFSLLLKNGTQYKPLAEAQPILAAARTLESAMTPALPRPGARRWRATPPSPPQTRSTCPASARGSPPSSSATLPCASPCR